ncbi:MAG TPA: hypothetical protein VGM37_05210 [Armatimonadota bacterium]|jgi:hypothetical protein
MTSNSHIHLPPNFSAFDSVEQAVRLAAEQGIRALGASNYYDYSVYAEFAERAERAGIFPLFGMEIVARDERLAADGVKLNDPGNPGKVYVCGKGIAPAAAFEPEPARVLNGIREGDARRISAMVSRMESVFTTAGFPTGLTDGAIVDGVVTRHGCPRDTVTLQERHVAQAFQEALFASTEPGARAGALHAILGAEPKAPDDAAAVQNDIRTHLMKAGRPAFVEERFVSFEEARALVLAMRGIPCYPVLADGASPICPFEAPVEGLTERLHRWDIGAVEFIPVRNRRLVLEEYVPALRDAGFIVTGGTEHNTREMIPLRPACIGREPLPDPIRGIFEEGACVLAAHQRAVLAGEPGFNADPDITRWALLGREILGL